MDDDLIKPLNPEDEEELEDLDDLDDPLLVDGKRKAKKDLEGDDSIEDLAAREDDLLPEDSFDDVEPEDLW